MDTDRSYCPVPLKKRRTEVVFNWFRATPAVRNVLMPLIIIRRYFIKRKQKNRRIMRANMFRRINDGKAVFDLPEYKGIYEIGILSDLCWRIMMDGTYEAELAELTANTINPYMDAIDVGANIGLFTGLMAHTIKKGRFVLSLEPTAGAFKLLEKNIKRNNIISNVKAYQMAATKKEGSIDMNVCVGREEYSSCGTIVHPLATGTYFEIHTVKSTTIDILCINEVIEPGFIKIDVEGHEHDVLKGAKHTLLKYRPAVLLELSENMLAANGSNSKAVLDYFTKANYQLFNAYYPAKKATPPFEGTILAIPE